MGQTVPVKGETSRAGEAPTYERLLTVAAGLFRRYGYAGTSTRALAEALGIQKASLYYHMPTKEQLLYALASRSMDHMDEQILPAVNAARLPAEKLDALITSHVRTMLDQPDAHAATLLEMRSLNADHRAQIHARRRAYEKYVADILRAGQTSGDVRSDLDADHLALLVLGTMNWTLFWFSPGGELTADETARMVREMIRTGVLGHGAGNCPGRSKADSSAGARPDIVAPGAEAAEQKGRRKV